MASSIMALQAPQLVCGVIREFLVLSDKAGLVITQPRPPPKRATSARRFPGCAGIEHVQ